MKKLIYLFTIPMIIMSCNEAEETNTEAVTEIKTVAAINYDLINDQFVTAWNAKDSTKLMSMIADDVVLLSGINTVSGKDALMSQWLRPNLKYTNDLSSNLKTSGESNEMAYFLSTYTLMVEEPDKEARQEKGSSAFVWEPQSDNNWRITTIHLSPVLSE